MKKFILCIGLLIAFYDAYAQSAPVRMTLSRRDKPITMRIDGISADIEGYDGDELIINPVPDSTEIPLAAKGLKQIPLLRQEATDKYPKMTDNERGLSVTIPIGYARKISVKVPQECLVYVISMAYIKGLKVYISNVTAVDVGAIIPYMHLNNVSSFQISSGGATAGLSASDRIILTNIRYSTEPMVINGKPQQRNYFAGANSATIELNVPENLKSDIVCLSRNGQILSDIGVAPETKVSERGIEFWRGIFAVDDIPAIKELKMNGGGLQVAIKANYGNVLIKKQN